MALGVNVYEITVVFLLLIIIYEIEKCCNELKKLINKPIGSQASVVFS